MATIRTAIELQDNFTGVLYQVINSVNLGLSAMEDLHQTMNSPVDTASIEAARDSINQATIAVQQLDAAMQGLETPATETPTAPTNSAPVVLPVQPDVPDPLVDQPAPVDLPVEPEQPEPVQVPVHWQSDNMEVFTSTGVERFEQEVQSANNMLNTLNQTQSRIAAQAAQTDLFPDNAIADMNNMQNRLQAIQQRIQTIESNPLNMVTDTANAELEQLREQLDQAVQEQQNLNRAVDNMDVEAANQAYLRLSQTVGNTERYIRDNVDEQGRFNREIEEGTNEANSLMQTIKGAVAAYATIQTLSAALNLSDQLTTTTARMNLMNDGLQTTQDLQNMIYLSAERARGSYQATADAVSKLGLMAGDAFGSSQEIIAFMEQINKQFTIAGTEAAGVDAAMLQLTQAMASGVLRGEELNSIFEQAPTIIQSIADYLDVPIGSIREMAAEGQITADIVKAAVFAAADETNCKI
jgi:tape measure domain-containing protein